MSQKGGIALIVLIVVVLAGLLVGVYLISQNTNWFSKAGSNQITIPYPSPSAYISSSGQSSTNTTYENPFDESSTSQNPFDNYQNPFDNL